MQGQSFYDKLPYTLPEDQADPQYVIFGTGLQECLIAAFKSKIQGKIGLILDTDKTYGSSIKTMTFKQIHELNTKVAKQKIYDFFTPETFSILNNKYFDECLTNKKHRGYNIDIQPSYFYASSLACQCLKQADMDKYMDFHLVTTILHLDKSSQTFSNVPLSKGKIFESKQLSLLEKKNLLMSLHKLIKIYQKYMQIEEDMNSTKQFDKDFGDIDEDLYKEFLNNKNDYFLPFISKISKKSKKILDYLTYVICNYQYNYENQVPSYAKKAYSLGGFIQKFGKFIKSCGIYGQTPYLYVDNGIGDIPQAFSRIASIFGSTYILHPKITFNKPKILENQIIIESNLSPQRPIKTKQVYYGPTHYQTFSTQQQQFHLQYVYRLVLICQKLGKQEKCPALVYLLNLQCFINPIYLFMFDNTTQSCPENLILYQFEVVINEDQGKQIDEKCHKLIELMSKESIRGQKFKESIQYIATYKRLRKFNKKQESKQNSKQNIVMLDDTMGVDLDQHFLNFEKVVGKKENYFKKENQQKEEDDEPFGGYETNILLEQLDSINFNQNIEEKNSVKEEPIQKIQSEQFKNIVQSEDKGQISQSAQNQISKEAAQNAKIEQILPQQQQSIKEDKE